MRNIGQVFELRKADFELCQILGWGNIFGNIGLCTPRYKQMVLLSLADNIVNNGTFGMKCSFFKIGDTIENNFPSYFHIYQL